MKLYIRKDSDHKCHHCFEDEKEEKSVVRIENVFLCRDCLLNVVDQLKHTLTDE